jgi:SAM-dependent methyltransferase
MKHDPIEAEKLWRKTRPKPGKKSTALSERQSFPHRLVRAELGNALTNVGCKTDSQVLDIGCGSGEDIEYISRVSKHITGVDISPEAISAFQATGFNGIVADVKNLPFPDGSFDFVVCPAVLHHLIGQGKLDDFIVEFVRVLKPGGYLLALEPNAYNLSGILMNIMNALMPGITGLVPHERALSPLKLMHIFNRAGLGKVKCTAASFTWNRLPLFLSRFIARHEKRCRYARPFSYLGWFSIIYGARAKTNEMNR